MTTRGVGLMCGHSSQELPMPSWKKYLSHYLYVRSQVTSLEWPFFWTYPWCYSLQTWYTQVTFHTLHKNSCCFLFYKLSQITQITCLEFKSVESKNVTCLWFSQRTWSEKYFFRNIMMMLLCVFDITFKSSILMWRWFNYINKYR